MKSTADVVIIGTGVIGCSTAYHLAQIGIKDVVAVEMDGFILNCGWGGRGIIQAPVAGRLVAETICNGYASTMDIHSLRNERFKETVLHS